MLAPQCFIQPFFSLSVLPLIWPSGSLENKATPAGARLCLLMTQRSCDCPVRHLPSLPPFHSGGRRSRCRRASGGLAAHVTTIRKKKKKKASFVCVSLLCGPRRTWASSSIPASRAKCAPVCRARTSDGHCGFLSVRLSRSLAPSSLALPGVRSCSTWQLQLPSSLSATRPF